MFHRIHRNTCKTKGIQGRQSGGAAIEYILVSMFATAISVVGVGYVGGIVKNKIKTFAEKYKLDSDMDEFDVGGF